jgi:hypothetical protein
LGHNNTLPKLHNANWDSIFFKKELGVAKETRRLRLQMDSGSRKSRKGSLWLPSQLDYSFHEHCFLLAKKLCHF